MKNKEKSISPFNKMFPYNSVYNRVYHKTESCNKITEQNWPKTLM